MRTRIGSLSIGVLLLLAGWSSSAAGQDYLQTSGPAETVTTSSATMDSIIGRLEALEASQEDKKKAADPVDEWVDVSKEKWTYKIGGRVMIDYANFADQNDVSRAVVGDAQDYFDFRRMYLGVEGEAYGIYEYKFEVDFAPSFSVRNSGDTGTININGVQMKDVYWGIKEVPWLGTVLVGHFKAPMSMEELTSSRFITFMERSAPNIFVPARELGSAAYNRNAAETMTWGYGVFVDNLDEIAKERESDNQGATFAARATWLPYYDDPSDGRYLLHTGVSYRYTNDQDDRIQFRAREETGLGPRWIDTGTILSDEFNVLQTEAALVWGPFSLQSEFFFVPVQDDGAAPAGNWAGFGPVDRNFYGTYVYGSWFLTGESRKYRKDRGTFDRVAPNTNFWAIRGAGIGSGAIELTSRLSYLDLRMEGVPVVPGGTVPDQYRNAGMETDVTLGVNWYWNPNLRWMFNYIHSWNTYEYRDGTAENDILMFSTRVDF